MKRRLLATFLSLCLLMGMLPTAALAVNEPQEEPVQSATALDSTSDLLSGDGATDDKSGSCGAGENDNVTWKLEENNEGEGAPTYTLTISGEGAMADYSGATATPWYEKLSSAGATTSAYNGKIFANITKIVIKDGVTRIGSQAFGYSMVSEIDIADTVESIGSGAFVWDCWLKELEIPSSIKNMNRNDDGTYYNPLDGTFNLEKVSVSGDNPVYQVVQGGILLGPVSEDSSELMIINCPDNLGNGTSVVSNDFPANTVLVGNTAFGGCRNLTSIALPETITQINSSAFLKCYSLTSFDVPEAVTELSNSVFQGCSSLSEVSLNNVEVIGEYAFGQIQATEGNNTPHACTALKTLDFSNVKRIQKYAFQYSGLEQVTLPADIEIANFAFDRSNALTDLTFLGNYTVLAESSGAAQAFSNCDAIVNITFADGSTVELPANSFDDCIHLKSLDLSEVTLKDGLIGNRAFASCTSLESVILPQNSLHEIAYQAFYDTALTKVTLPETVTKLGQECFADIKTLLAVDATRVTSFDGIESNPFKDMASQSVIYVGSSAVATSLNGKYTTDNTCVAITNGGTFAEDTTFTSGTLATPTKDGAIFDGWYTSATFEAETKLANGAAITRNETYYAKWIGMDDIELQYGGEQTIAVSGVTLSGYQSDNPSVATVDQSGKVTATGVGTATISATGTYGEQPTTFKMTVTVTPRVLTYTLAGDDTGSGSITYNYSGGHHALADSLTFKWADEPSKEVTLVEGTDINYTYAVTDSEGQGGGTTQTYDYLPMPVGTYNDVQFNLLNENYTFALSGGATTGNTLEIDVNVVAEDSQRAYLASAWPKADQNFVYTGQGVLPVEGTLNAYEQDNTSSDTVDIGTFTINIEGLNGTSFNSEVSEIPAGTDLSAITDLALPTEPGTYIITASAASETHYLYKSLVFTISKATVTIKADNKSVYVGDAMPTLTYTPFGLVGDDELTAEPTLTCTAIDTNTAGTYTIAPSGGEVNTAHYTLAYENGTLTVSTRSSGGGGSSSSNVSGSGDNVSITASGGSVTVSQMESAVKKADEGATITIKATGSSNISLPASGLESAADNDNSLTLDLRYGEVTLSPEALSSVADQAGSTVTLTVAPVDTDELNSRQQAAVGDAPVFDLTIRSGSTVISDFDGGLATVSIPYELPSNQDPAGVVVWFLDDDGNITPCETMYDTRTETVIFTTRHFSKYVIGYEEPTVFTDVSEDAYYADAVLWAVANGVTYGTSATTFSPDMAVSRAQMVTFLWRAHGSPKASGANPFTDVSTSDYYYDAVLWAVANGVTYGTSATTFSPDMAVTRAQAVTFQWRAAGSPVVSGSSFGDVAADAYYVDAVTWAVANGITNGTSATTFSPDVVVSRAQAVTFLHRELG